MTNPTGSILVRRGPTEDRQGFYPLSGEIIYDTTTERFHIGDGETVGGVSVNQRDFPNPGVMIKGLTTDSYLVAPGDAADGAPAVQFLSYEKETGEYFFSTITSSGVAVTSLKLSGANGITVTRTDSDPDIVNPTITTTGEVAIDVNSTTLKTYLSLNNVTNESKATMFASATLTGTTTMSTLSVGSSTGTNGQVLTSTGSGLQWTSLSSSSISNGTSNVSIPVANGNISFTTNGAYTATLDTNGNFTIPGNFTVNGNQTYVQGTNTVYTDNVLEIHAPTGGVGGTWGSNDGKDIGWRFHYYDSEDKNAALYMDNSTWRLRYTIDAVEVGGQFIHQGLGDIEAANFRGNVIFPDGSVQNTAANNFFFSVGADDSTLRSISNTESIKFAGSGGITTASDAEGNITITMSSNPSFTTVSDQYGNLRSIQQSSSDKTSSYTLAASDTGRFIGIGTSGSIVIPTGVFSNGNAVSLYNNTTGNVTITCSALTTYVAGTNTARTSLTFATRGVATVLFISGTVCVISGNVS
jgi:hypothetical protein